MGSDELNVMGTTNDVKIICPHCSVVNTYLARNNCRDCELDFIRIKRPFLASLMGSNIERSLFPPELQIPKEPHTLADVLIKLHRHEITCSYADQLIRNCELI